MQSRITIIDNYKSFLGQRKKSIENRLKYLAVLKYLSAFIVLLVFLIIIKSLLPLNFLNDKLKWNDSALIVMLSITYLIQGPRYFYESKLLSHLKKVENEEMKTSNEVELNKELENTIHKINDPKSNWLVIASIAVLMIISLIQLISGNFEYWIYFRIPFLIFITTILFDFIKNYNLLNRNIKEYEKQ